MVLSPLRSPASSDPTLGGPEATAGASLCQTRTLRNSAELSGVAQTPITSQTWVVSPVRRYSGLFLMLTVLSINLIGDGLRDLLKV